MITDILAELKLDSRLARFDRGYKDGVDYGMVLAQNGELVALRTFDRDGLYDGVKLVRIADIENIEWNGNNCGSRMKFITRHGLDFDAPDVDCASWDSFLDSASQRFGYVCLNDDRSANCWIGPLVSFDDDYVHLVNLGNPSRLDRTNTLIDRGQVTSMEVDSIYQRNLAGLHGLTQAEA